MPSEIAAFLNALPQAATSPYALAAYICTILAWIIVSYRVTRNKNLLDKISDLPEQDRIHAISAEMGTPIPPGLTAEEWLRSLRNKYIVIGFVVLVISTGAVACVALLQPASSYPKRLSRVSTAELQVSSVDDFMQVYVNDHLVEDAKFGDTPPWRPFRAFLHQGANAVKIIITNGQYGGCGGTITFQINGKVYDELRHSWVTPMNQAFANAICTLEVFTIDFD